MILGVLGGMGPMATVDFMTKVIRNTPASRDQDHVAMVVCSATYVPDRSEAICGHGDDPFPAMLDALRRLERAGADCIAIPCNTAHHWHGALQARTNIPILHIVDAVVDLLARQGIKKGRIGLLATDGTIAADVYPKRLDERGFSCVMPDAAAQADIMGAIRLVKAGHTDEGARILEAAARDMTAKDCCRVAMACTEIPLALATVDEPLRSRLVDPTDALACASVDMCLPHRLATKVVLGQRRAG
jgi:aspartate racemase